MPQAPSILKLNEADNVAIAVRALNAGETVPCGNVSLKMLSDAPVGHKIAIRPIAPGEKIVKWGCPIGSATKNIAQGEHVHTHNVKSDYIPTFSWGESKDASAKGGLR